MEPDLIGALLSANGYGAVVLSATGAQAGIDFSLAKISTFVYCDLLSAGGTQTVSFQVEESADNATNWTAISGLVFAGVTVTTAASRVQGRGLRTHRYVRVNVTALTGTIYFNPDLYAWKQYSSPPGVLPPGGFSRSPST